MKPPKNWSEMKLDRSARKLKRKTGSLTESRAALVALFGSPSK